MTEADEYFRVFERLYNLRQRKLRPNDCVDLGLSLHTAAYYLELMYAEGSCHFLAFKNRGDQSGTTTFFAEISSEGIQKFERLRKQRLNSSYDPATRIQ